MASAKKKFRKRLNDNAKKHPHHHDNDNVSIHDDTEEMDIPTISEMDELEDLR